MAHLDPRRVHARFPGVAALCAAHGIDLARDPVPVTPAAHYSMGGVMTDLRGRTTVPGLWAVGECASSGLHGANRMGSNSLLEGLVLGVRAGRHAADEAQGKGIQDWHVRAPRELAAAPDGMRVNLQDVTYSLKSLLWRQMGIEREAAQIQDALAKIRLWSRAVSELGAAEPATWELVNLLTVAHLAALSALARTESRGVHFRTDHPRPDPAWQAHTRCTPVFEEGHIEGVVLERVPLRHPAPLATR
jgi:L-aspartate oxidase